MTHFAQDVRDIWRLAFPYFRRRTPGEIHLWLIGPVRMPENWIGIGLLACVVGLEVGASYMSKLINNWQEGFGDSIQSEGLARLPVVARRVLHDRGALRPRRGLQQLSQPGAAGPLAQVHDGRLRRPLAVARAAFPHAPRRPGPADNPDQRISDDIHQFVGNTMVLGIGFFGNFLRLGIFLQVLWAMSTAFPMTSFGLSFNIPGYLVWLAVLYAGAGTAITYVIGRRLVTLKYNQERFEANFRFGMARIRENSEQIALLGGERCRAGGARRALRVDPRQRLRRGAAAAQPHLLLAVLRPVLLRLPLPAAGPGLLLRHRHLRRADEGGGHLRPRAGRPDLVRRLVPAPRQLPRHRAAPRQLRGGDGPQRRRRGDEAQHRDPLGLRPRPSRPRASW